MFYINIKVSSFPTDSKIWCEPLYCWNHQCLNAFVIKWWLELINLTVTLSRKPVVSGVVVDLHNTFPPPLAQPLSLRSASWLEELHNSGTPVPLIYSYVVPQPHCIERWYFLLNLRDSVVIANVNFIKIDPSILKFIRNRCISLQTENYVWKIWDKLCTL